MSARVKTDFLANAREAWGNALPDWVEALAIQANVSSATEVAARLSYSVAVVSSVCRASYKGDLKRVEEKVRGAYMGVVVECPVLGEIARDRCLDEQAKSFSGTSALRTRTFRACRNGCQHSRLKRGGGDG